MADNTSMLDRLKAQLLTSGLSLKDQPLFQVINQLLDFVRGVQTNVTEVTKTTAGISGNYAKLDGSNVFTKINPITTPFESWIGPSTTTGIYFNNGNVGIGNNAPQAPLDVIGKAAFTINTAGVSPPLSPAIKGIDVLTATNNVGGTNVGISGWITNGILGFVSQTLIGLDLEVGGGGLGNSFGITVAMDGTEAGTRYAFHAILTGSGSEYSFHCATAGAVLYNEGNVGIGQPSPTASLEIKASPGAGGDTPIKFNAGTLVAALELGAMEFTDDGTDGHLYITVNVAGVLTRVQIV